MTSPPAVGGEFAEFGERLVRVRAVARFKFDADEKNFFRACVRC